MSRAVFLFVLLASAALALPGCREDRQSRKLSARDEALLLEKSDERIGRMVRERDGVPFAGVAVFRSDAFLSQSAMLERRDLPVLDTFGKAAVILLKAAEVPALLSENAVVKVRFLCRQGPLARLHPALLMDVLARFSDGREDEPVSLFVRFRDPPTEDDAKAIGAAGFAVGAVAGNGATVTGPPSSLARLLDNERIVYYEGASKTRGM